MPELTDEELDLCDTERLLDALQRRTDSGLVVTMMHKTDMDNPGVFVLWGAPFETYGLVNHARDRIRERLMRVKA